jgi:hypothetical protein
MNQRIESLGPKKLKRLLKMKTLIKLTVAAALAAMLGTAAWADDPALQNRLALQRAQAERNKQTTTIAVYGAKGVGERVVRETRKDVRMERHDTGRATHYIYRPAK